MNDIYHTTFETPEGVFGRFAFSFFLGQIGLCEVIVTGLGCGNAMEYGIQLSVSL